MWNQNNNWNGNNNQNWGNQGGWNNPNNTQQERGRIDPVTLKSYITKNDPRFSEENSIAYRETLYQILVDGLEDVCDNEYVTTKSFAAEFYGGTGLVVSLSLEQPKHGTTALNNFVLTSEQAQRYGVETRVIDADYINKERAAYEGTFATYRVTDPIRFIQEYANLITLYQDNTVEFINAMYTQFGGVLPEADEFFMSPSMSFGGIQIHPVIDNNEVGFRMELDLQIKNRLKRDIMLTSKHE